MIVTMHSASTSTCCISHLRMLSCSNKTRAPTANLPNSAQLEASPTIPPSYIQVRAIVWAGGRKQTHRHTCRYTHLQCITCIRCHSNETGGLIANPPNSAQLGGTPYNFPSYVWVCAVLWACGHGHTHRHTHTETHVTNIHFVSSTTRAKCNLPLAQNVNSDKFIT